MCSIRLPGDKTKVTGVETGAFRRGSNPGGIKGLWGVKSILQDESGPPGPKWDRPDKFFMIYPRLKREKLLEWLRDLKLLRNQYRK